MTQRNYLTFIPPRDAGTGGGGGPTITNQLWIAAGAMRGSLQFSPAASCSVLTQIALGTSGASDLITLNFDPTTQEYAEFSFAMPSGYDGESVTFNPYWAHGTTTTNFGVVWSLCARAFSDGDNIDVAQGTEQTSTDTGGTINTLYIGPASSTITIAGSPAANDLVLFRISRVTGNGSDTMAIDAKLLGVMLNFA